MAVDCSRLKVCYFPSRRTTPHGTLQAYGISPESGRTKSIKEPGARPTLAPPLDLGLLRDIQCVIDLDPKVSNSRLILSTLRF